MPDPVAPQVVPVVPVTPPVDPALALVTPPATVVPPVTPPVVPPASITAPVTPPVPPPATPPAVPEKYDLKLPEKSVLEASAVDEIAAYAKAQGLSQVQAAASSAIILHHFGHYQSKPPREIRQRANENLPGIAAAHAQINHLLLKRSAVPSH